MEIVRCSTPDEFLAASITYRAAEPIRTNVIGSVATSVVDGVRAYDAHWWWIVRGDDGDVVGAALRTAPFGLQLGPMPVGADQPSLGPLPKWTTISRGSPDPSSWSKPSFAPTERTARPVRSGARCAVARACSTSSMNSLCPT